MTSKERLERWAAVMDEAAADGRPLNMRFWLPGTGGHPSGAARCAASWAALDPALAAEGLRISAYGGPVPGPPSSHVAFSGEQSNYGVVAAFFGISGGDARFLTHPDFYAALPLAAEVAARIRAVAAGPVRA